MTRLQASVRLQVASGQTLLTGGWVSEPGKRIFVLATPRIEGDNSDRVGIKTYVIEVPESALSKVGLDTVKAEGTESALQQVLAVEQMDALVKELEGTEGAKFFAQGSVLTTDGRQVELRNVDEQVIDGVNQNLGPVINIVPVISGDKSAIDIRLQVGISRLAPKAQ